MVFKFIIFSHTITVCNTSPNIFGINSISESEWVEYYKSLLDNNSSDLIRAEPNLGTAQTPSPLDFPFNCSEIKKGIKRLKIVKKKVLT
jgi:hypothetical protein